MCATNTLAFPHLQDKTLVNKTEGVDYSPHCDTAVTTQTGGRSKKSQSSAFEQHVAPG